ncbi:D-alanyl-D-alanine carboxypeptidase family protein [Ancylothrix sp. C2]|uniref:M15 family metallopeptidase n=1 Tax=Ancylothrix sp. D3o TaxID=2953691 RepID=UPI0021BAABC5|nr:M15 family metallopeptidase [Ancylothrix sp. D3o]MCT7951548.1 D-alanyl-D-alanine carboxypeptidase family protein [Ancylothrix sp. D3o]
MTKAGSSGKPFQNSTPGVDDIPIALRDTRQAQKKPLNGRVWLIGGTVGIILTLLTGLGFALMETQNIAKRQLEENITTQTTPAPSEPTATATTPATTQPKPEALLGHFPYKEAPLSELAPITSDGSIKMRKAAAEAFNQMQAAARAEGINLVVISGFRSIKDQDYLFFEVKAERGQTASTRANVSAPPGYSEHHTGYAVDIGDGNVPATNLSPDFENTPAYKWLEANAAHYSFEISFPRNNPQGVSYEPWHWRFVGDTHSLETFYKARGNQ